MKFIIVCTMLFTISCMPNNRDSEIMRHESKFEGPGADSEEWDYVNEIRYLRDKRTNLCFGYFRQDRGPGFANVPCTDEVMKLIKGE